MSDEPDTRMESAKVEHDRFNLKAWFVERRRATWNDKLEDIIAVKPHPYGGLNRL